MGWGVSKTGMIEIIQLADTRIEELIDFILENLDLEYSAYEKLERLVLNELITSIASSGATTVAVNGDEDIIGVCLAQRSTSTLPRESWTAYLARLRSSSSIWEGSMEIMKTLNSSLNALPEIEWRKNLASNTSWAMTYITNHSQLINRLVEYQTKAEELFNSVSCSNSAGGSDEILTIPFVLVAKDYRKQGLMTMMLSDLHDYCQLERLHEIHLIYPSDFGALSKSPNLKIYQVRVSKNSLIIKLFNSKPYKAPLSDSSSESSSS